MLVIPCPYCGPRDQDEFVYGGEAHRARPAEPQALSDAEWADFVFMRDNAKGPHRERWCHAAGCGRWFNVIRSTASDRVFAAYGIGEPWPDLPEEARPTPAGEAAGSGNDAAKLMGKA